MDSLLGGETPENDIGKLEKPKAFAFGFLFGNGGNE